MPELPSDNAGKRKPTIGLLGAPGSGKSLIARQFEQLGCAVIDADALARQALDEPAVRGELVRWWGGRVLDDQGQVDRAAVGRMVFEDAARLHRLEGLIHPRVHARRQELRRRYLNDSRVKAIVEDCPLLLEKDLARDVDVFVYVDAPRALRLARVREHRGWSEEELARREKNQWPLDIKRDRADYVVTNHASEDESFEQVRRVLSQILHPTRTKD